MTLHNRPFLLLIASVFFVIGCDSPITAPTSGDPALQASSSATADVGAKAGPRGPAAPQPACDVTVDPGSSIDEAVDNSAQAGDLVCVESGTYVEQVTINKDLTLKGLDNPTIQMPSGPEAYVIPESGPTWEPVVFAFGGDAGSEGEVSGSGTVEVTVQGFTIDGRGQRPDARRAVGLFYRNAGGTVRGNTVENMAIGGKETFGILAYGDSNVEITRNTVDGYERGGIGANGDGGAHPDPEVLISRNVLIGSGQGKEISWAANGIQVGYGASGRVTSNVVKNSRWANFDSDGEVEERERDDWRAACVLVFESGGVQVRDNRISNCDVGLSVGSWAWFVPSADNTKIVQNEVEEAGVGVLLEAVAFGGSQADASVSNTKVIGNDLSGGSHADVGVVLSSIDGSSDFDPVLQNNKVVNNRISDFGRSIVDEGSETKAQANDRPFAP